MSVGSIARLRPSKPILLKSIELKMASAGGVRVPVNLPSIASGMWGVGEIVGVSDSDGVSVIVGERVMLGVNDTVGVSVIVDDAVGVKDGM